MTYRIESRLLAREGAGRQITRVILGKSGSRKPDMSHTSVQIAAVSLPVSHQGLRNLPRSHRLLVSQTAVYEARGKIRLLKDMVDSWLVCLNLLSGISSVLLRAFWAEG